MSDSLTKRSSKKPRRNPNEKSVKKPQKLPCKPTEESVQEYITELLSKTKDEQALFIFERNLKRQMESIQNDDHEEYIEEFLEKL